MFSSVCGNTFLIAQAFEKALNSIGIETCCFRVEDDTLETVASQFPSGRDYLQDILAVSFAKPEYLLEADLILLGSPTYFGAVSGKMKTFLESTSLYWMQSALVGKLLMAFTTAANNEGGAHLCLQTMHTFALHQGMIPIPLPFIVSKPLIQPAYGLVHYTGEEATIRPTGQLNELVERWIKWVFRMFRDKSAEQDF